MVIFNIIMTNVFLPCTSAISVPPKPFQRGRPIFLIIRRFASYLTCTVLLFSRLSRTFLFNNYFIRLLSAEVFVKQI